MTVAVTSAMAKASLTKGVTEKQKGRIFAFVLKRGSSGATIEEMSLNTGIVLQTVCARRNEMGKRGLIIDGGTRRPNRSGRTATVWVVPRRLRERAVKIVKGKR